MVESGGVEGRSVRPTRRVSALLGFLLKGEAVAIFEQQPFETIDSVEPAELWRQFDERRQQLGPLTMRPVRHLDESLKATTDAVKSRKTYKRYYEAAAEYSFRSAPIESLLSPQWYADLDYVDEIASKLPDTMSHEEQIYFAMSEGKITEPIVTGNQVWFTSPRRDLFASQIPIVRTNEDGDFEIVVQTSSRPNYIQVAQIGDRLVLTNGVHKVCALYSRGYRECICVYRTAGDAGEAGLDPRSTSLFRDSVFKSPRPALVTDFLNPETGAPLRMRSMYQVLQVSVGVATISVPALPESRG